MADGSLGSFQLKFCVTTSFLVYIVVALSHPTFVKIGNPPTHSLCPKSVPGDSVMAEIKYRGPAGEKKHQQNKNLLNSTNFRKI